MFFFLLFGLLLFFQMETEKVIPECSPACWEGEPLCKVNIVDHFRGLNIYPHFHFCTDVTKKVSTAISCAPAESRWPKRVSWQMRMLRSWGCLPEQAHSSRTTGMSVSHDNVWKQIKSLVFLHELLCTNTGFWYLFWSQFQGLLIPDKKQTKTSCSIYCPVTSSRIPHLSWERKAIDPFGSKTPRAASPIPCQTLDHSLRENPPVRTHARTQTQRLQQWHSIKPQTETWPVRTHLKKQFSLCVVIQQGVNQQMKTFHCFGNFYIIHLKRKNI